ncbi:ATPase family AAA domain-containing protein 5 [Pseudomyrmex gracilis]|uniref:ATPase family AAA domain-containing protein 5 n=1 Tax=Pseudomyrmex gracilis TaxID=219809 RepID=UPI0009957CAB|nr:ATPase family AAA domain-containing protein 5 [Pseudomyrmex gracilis]
MKDIKQYFANGTKVVRKEIIADNSGSIMQQEDQEEMITTGKRRRVKIRISSNGFRRTCNVVESKNDLIDKTPSPLNSKLNDKTVQDATPKSCVTNSSLKQGFKKDSKLSTKTNASQRSKTAKNILHDKERLDNKSTLDLDNSDIQHINIQNSRDSSNTEVQSDNDFQEESNAFHVLMNHNKPTQLSPPQQSVTDAKSKEKLDDVKDKRFQHKEKLIELANKKGYSKRKLAEIEEGERIEKIIEKRMSFFKSDKDDTPKRSDNNGLSVKSNKPGNLLDYFSKSPLELTSKDEQCVTTFVVKADVHRADNSDELVNTAVSNEIHLKKTNSSKSKIDVSTISNIHVVKSENLSLLHTTKENKQKREKTWSLRIKLHSPEDNNPSNDSTDDELFSPKSKSKLNMSRKFRKSGNTDEKNNMISLKKNSHNHIKTIMENKEKEMDSANDVVINDKNQDVDSSLEKSSENRQTKEQINNIDETITLNDSDCEIINENVLKRKKPNEKLAPLFIKRRKTDPVIAAAKQLFLHSDMIDIEIKNINCKTNNSSVSKFLYPTISHVTQLKSLENLNPTKSEIKHKFSLKIKNKYLPSIDINDYKFIINHEKLVRIPDTKSEPEKEDLDQVLSEIEEFCSDTRELWKIISTIKNDSAKRSPSRTRNKKSRLFEQNKTVARNEENKLHDCVWTCKYKPMSVQEIVGNEEAAGKLKTWLIGWRASLKTNNDDNSSDEFYSSDCSYSCNNENNQIAVLLGPHGSGKSASVYAIAEELGYSVLEVNASSKRTGKRILKELEEATKSHRVKKHKHKFPLKQVANTSKSKEPKISQNSLILLEDIDLIFEEDEGFVSATYQLALNTKRPIVMTCRDMCPHLNKMAPQQNKIYFQKVNGNRVSALLQLISLAEKGYRLPHNCLMKLLRAGDLRQALLQLQYLLLSGPPTLSEQSMVVNSSLWQDVQYHLYKPVIKLDKKRKTEKKNKNTKKSNTACILDNLADDLDNISLASSLLDTEDTTLSVSEEKSQPNLSLTESVLLYSASRDLNTNIANFLSNQMLYKNSKPNENMQSQSNIILRKQLNRGVDQALSQVTSTCLDRRIMALDYLPTARTICRAEESRFAITNKRGNRFFHYLRSLENVSAVWMKPNILAAACKTLQEKVNKTTALQT